MAPMRPEPPVRETVMDVIRPRERDEHVYIQEPGQTSSSASRTMSGVSGGASGPTPKTGKPSARIACSRGWSVARASEGHDGAHAHSAFPGDAPDRVMDVGIECQRGSHGVTS